ncbi:MAG: hypothetical protein AAGJ96_09610 [Pseudomonadota bacterium]
MDAGILLLLGIVGLVVVLALGEALLTRNRPRRSLADTFEAERVTPEADIDAQGMTPQMRDALDAQMRLTAQAGAQGVRSTGGLGNSMRRWMTVPTRTTNDPIKYAKLFVPKGARDEGKDT